MSDSSDSESYAGSAASIAAIKESAEHRVTEQLVQAYDAIPLDRALVVQAQLSGLLHAQVQELHDLEVRASDRIPEIKAIAQKGRELIRQTTANIEWLKTHVKQLTEVVKDAHPIEYAEAAHAINKVESYY